MMVERLGRVARSAFGVPAGPIDARAPNSSAPEAAAFCLAAIALLAAELPVCARDEKLKGCAKDRQSD